MCFRVNALHALTGLALALATTAATADPPADATAIDRRWLPSFGPTAGITIQNMDGSAASRCFRGGVEELGPPPGFELEEPECEKFPPPNPLPESGAMRPMVSGSDLAVTPYLGGVLQILSPTIELFPGRPRVFATAETMYLFRVSRNIATEGDPGRVGYPTTLSPEARPFATTAALTGRGSRTSAEIQPLGLSASMGLAFPLDFLGRRLWLKPSVGWQRYEVDVEGTAVGGYKKACPTPPNVFVCGPFRPERNFREIQLNGSESQVFNGIGPGLELELETGRFGVIGSSLYLGLYGYRVLGNRNVSFSDSVLQLPGGTGPVCDGPGVVCGPADAVGSDGFDTTSRPDSYTATWNFKADPWIYRTGIGFRFHWIGFDR